MEDQPKHDLAARPEARRPRAVALRAVLAALGLLLTAPAGLAEPAARAATPPLLDEAGYDEQNARDILETCAACHGKDGEGGSDGTYPRLAGLPAEYLAAQIRAFKTRQRVNIPMFPYATERELPEDDVRDIAIYLSRHELLTRMPELPEGTSAYQRLLVASRVFNVPRVDGDVRKGERSYKRFCRRCHGEEGWGKDRAPQLAGQHTEYLRRQIGLFRAGERPSAEADMLEALERLDAVALEDLFAYLASRDD